MLLLNTAFFPPVEYFALIADGMIMSGDKIIPSEVFIEAHESFQKQSYRNRCRYLSADGVRDLQVPIIHDRHQIPIMEVRVDYSTPWVIRAERSISSAYESSAYFDYYKDELLSILDSKPEKLWELNMSILRFFLDKIGIRTEIRPTKDFTTEGKWDIHPKRTNTILKDMGLEKPYFQVFSQKYGFIPNLSIMDLLFNEGPDSIMFLKKV